MGRRPIASGALMCALLAVVTGCSDKTAPAAVVAATEDSARAAERVRAYCEQRANRVDRAGCAAAAMVPTATTDTLELMKRLGLFVGNWRLTEDVDPMTDSKTTSVYLTSANISDIDDRTMAITVNCEKGKLDAFIVTGSYVGSTATVETRAGSAPAHTEEWKGLGGQAVIVPGSVREFVKGLATEEKYTVRVRSRGSPPVTAEFAVTGIDKALEGLGPGCAE